MTKPPAHDDFQLENLPKLPRKPVGAQRRTSQDTLRALAAFHMLYGQSQNAEKFLKIALWIDPNDAQAKRLFAHSLARRGEPMEAARVLIAATKLPGSDVSYADWREVGLALLRYGYNSLGMKLLGKKKGSRQAVDMTEL